MPAPTPRASLSLVPPLPVHPQDKLQWNEEEGMDVTGIKKVEFKELSN